MEEVYGVYVSANVSSVWFRGCRYYLGVGKLHPKAAIVGDMGWIPIRCKLMLDAISLWYHLTCVLASQLCNQVYTWSRQMCEECGVKNWCGIVKKILHECGLESLWQRNQVDGLSAKEFKSMVECCLYKLQRMK